MITPSLPRSLIPNMPLRVLILCHALINESNGVILIKPTVKVGRDSEANVGSTGRERRFEFKGGVPCLDFINTLAWRLTDRPVEYLGSYEDVLAWGKQAGLLAPDETAGPSRGGGAGPQERRKTIF